jgi:hypothetical protein
MVIRVWPSTVVYVIDILDRDLDKLQRRYCGNLWHTIADATGNHVNHRFVQMVISGKGADEVHTEQRMARREIRFTFTRRDPFPEFKRQYVGDRHAQG